MTPPSGEDDGRKHGIEFGDLDDELDAHDYPASAADLVEAYGDYELVLPDGAQQFRALIEPVGEMTFESPEEVKQVVFNMVDSDAVGREGYTDRGTTAVGTAEEDDPESI